MGSGTASSGETRANKGARRGGGVKRQIKARCVVLYGDWKLGKSSYDMLPGPFYAIAPLALLARV